MPRMKKDEKVIKNDMGEPATYDSKEKHTDIVWARVDIVMTEILTNQQFLESKRNRELTEWTAKQFKCSDKTAQRYISLAKSGVRKIGQKQAKKAFDKAIRDRELLIRKALAEDTLPGLRLAKDVMKDRDELFGMYVQKVENKTEINLKGIDLTRLNDEQLITLEKLVKEGNTDNVKAFLIGLGFLNA